MRTAYNRLVVILFILFSSLSIVNVWAQDVSSFSYDKCQSQITFKLQIAQQYETPRPACSGDYARDYHSGTIAIVTNSSTHTPIFELDAVSGHTSRSGWISRHVHGDADRTVFFKLKSGMSGSISNTWYDKDESDCGAGAGRKNFTNRFYVNVTIDVPPGLIGNGESIQAHVEGNWGGSGNRSWTSGQESTVEIPTIRGNLEVEKLCNGVKLFWEKPSFGCSNASYVIRRDGNVKGEVSFNTTEWVDYVAYDHSGGYNYEVSVKHNANMPNEGLTKSETGNPILNFDSPSYFKSFDLSISNLCQQSVRLEWGIDDQVDIDYFEVERAMTNQFDDPIVETVTQTFGTISFEDSGVPVNQDYYYRVRAYDNCGNATYINDTDIKHIMFEGPPSKPTIMKITTALDGADSATIEWTYPIEGTSVDHFIVYRDGIERGELSGNTFSFKDGGLSNCFEYEYQVIAVKECFDDAKSMMVNKQISFNTDLNGFDEFTASKYYYNDRVSLKWHVSADSEAKEVVIYRKREGSEDTPEVLKRMDIQSSTYDDYDTEPGVLFQYGLLAISCDGYVPSKEEVAAMVTDVGVRSETGIINGKITYQGGNAVEGVRVLATPSDGENRGVSLNMSDNQLRIPLDKKGENWFPDQWTLSFWFRMHDKSSFQSILSVEDGSDFMRIEPLEGGQTDFYDIDYRDDYEIIGEQDELVGYLQANGEVISLKDRTILGRKDGVSFTVYDKQEISGIVSNDTLYDFQSREPWMHRQSDEWYELSKQSANVAIADSLFGYLIGDTIYEAFDSDFQLAFIDGDQLRLARHYNISYALGENYAYIKSNQMVFAKDTTLKGDIIDDVVYSTTGEPIHMIVGSNVFYVYQDPLNNQLVRGKRFARKVPNTTNPSISFDVVLLDKTITEEIQKGDLLGLVSTDKSKVFEAGGAGLIKYLIDDEGIVRTAKYADVEAYLPALNPSYNQEGHALISLNTGERDYLLNGSQDSLYSIQTKNGVIDQAGFITDSDSGDYMYFLGDEMDEETQVYKAVATQVDFVVSDTVETYQKEAFQAQVSIRGGNLGSTETMLSTELYLMEYNNLMLTYDGDHLIYFVNGQSVDTVLVTGLSSLFKSSNQQLVFGGFDGLLDETLIWSEAKDSLAVAQDFNRYLSGGQDHLVGYWRLDEKVSTNSFDASYAVTNTGEKAFNGHHAFVAKEQWSNIVPEQEDLSFTSYTDEDGNYSIQSIIYAGSGNNFKVVPILGTHRFEPTNKVLFLGPSQKIQNEKDFKDQSSFRVTGTVKYDPRVLGFDDEEDPSAPNCYVEEVQLYIDNQQVVGENGQIVTTDKNGRFEIDVPIGKHQIKVAREGHSFAFSTWPPENKYDFQGDVNDLIFYDNTTRTLIGKVVGGTTEGEKISGSGESVNNIGVAEIKLKSIGKTCYETIITTDSTTGEYEVDLPPFRYNIVDLSIATKSASYNRELRKLAEASIDLSRDDLVLDTVQCAGPTCSRPEVYYHLSRDFVYRVPSKFTVKQYSENLDGSLSAIAGRLGAASVDLIDGNTVDFESSSLAYDVFTQGGGGARNGQYIWGISLTEDYVNNDFATPVIYKDTIKAGEILIENEVAGEALKLDLAEGEIIYRFLAGEPSLLYDRQNPELSFTKAVQIAGPTSNWNDRDNLYRAIVLGATLDNTQNSFYTYSDQSYQLVSLILRDPPGSQSYSEFAKKTKVTKIRNTTLKEGFKTSNTARIGSFFEWENMFSGVEDVKTKNTLGIKGSREKYREFNESSIITFEEGLTLATSTQGINTGAGSDVFMGNALNIHFAPSHNLEILPVDQCGIDAECMGNTFFMGTNEYSFARTRSVSVGLEESTQFIYTQRQIEQFIQDIDEELRDYPNSPLYDQLKNQSRIWKSAIAQNEYEKLLAKKKIISLTSGEVEDGNLYENVSFGYGSDIQKSYELGVQNQNNFKQQYSHYVGFELRISLGFFGFLQEFDMDIGQSSYAESVRGAQDETSQKTVIHLKDNDPGDQYSVDMLLSNLTDRNVQDDMNAIYDDFNGGAKSLPSRFRKFRDEVENEPGFERLETGQNINPIFITRGGRTSCPYEPQEFAKYLEYLKPELLDKLVDEHIIDPYVPHPSGEDKRYQVTMYADQDSVLNYGTFKRDQPGLRIEPRVQRGIPWDQANRATFDLILENLNQEDTIRSYTLMVDQRTTGAGPTMRLDGERFVKGTPIPLYGGEQLTKKITVRPVEDVYDYENMVIYLVSGCQFDFGQDLDFQEDIYARDTISVYFDPACPKATSIAPTAGWIVNNQTTSTLQVEIQEESYYFSNHDKVKLQFKATYQSDEDWVDAAVWSRDSAEVEELSELGENYFYFPVDNNYIVYDWDTEAYDLPDGTYQIRWEYQCTNGLASFSAPIAGTIDRTSPHAFGRPSPADGVLSPNDEIVLTLNEQIEVGLVDRDFISVRGKVNNTELMHTSSVRFSDSENDQVIIPNIQLKGTPITVEMWVQRSEAYATREQEILSHSEPGGTTLSLRLLADGKLQLKINDQTLTSAQAVDLSVWSHVALSLDPTEHKASLFHNGTLVAFDESFVAHHFAEGPIVLGGIGATSFTGNVHELRLWGKYMGEADLVQNFYRDLIGREIGLIGYWPLNEGRGDLAQDKVLARHAQVNASWWTSPSSLSFSFEGTNELKLGSYAFADDEDFTIEFWFKATGTTVSDTMTLVSNGNIAGLDWEILINKLGQVVLKQDGTYKTLVNSSVLDEQWHHLALVVNRIGNTTTYLDKQSVSTYAADLFGEFGGPQLVIGASLNINLNNDWLYSKKFAGQIDEFRIWRMAKRAEQVERIANYKLEGSELGLVCYLPFEEYDDFLRISEGTIACLSEGEMVAAASTGLELYSPENPGIILKPYETPVYFNYSVSGDKVIITLDEDNPAVVENCVLDVSVRNLVDKNGNVMKSPVTWSVFVDRNQVTWNERVQTLEKHLGDELTFSAKLSNAGGEARDFTIDNLPLWLTAQPSSGTIAPDAEIEINFTVNQGLNIGTYQQPIHLRTDFGFNESLLLNLKVYEDLPDDWQFAPEDYQYTMSLIGQVQIEDYFSIDPEDYVGVFVNDSLRGMAHLEYREVYDNYQAFLTVYSNNNLGTEALEFRIWDASAGQVLTDISVPQIAQNPVMFIQNEIYGTPSSPVTFLSENNVIATMNMPGGWKWVSFNLQSSDLDRTRNLFKGQALQEGDRILSLENVDVYDAENDLWIGTLAADNLPSGSGGIDIQQAYRVYSADPQQIKYSGRPVETLNNTIRLYSERSVIKSRKWNWVSYLGQENMEINEALSSVQAEEGDVIRSQYAFAMYDPVLKWVGSLEYLRPGEGYLIRVSSDQQLTFPTEGLINASRIMSETALYEAQAFNPHQFRENMHMVVQVVGLDLNEEPPLLAAYVEGDLRGVAKATRVGDKDLYYLTVYGDASETLDFKVVDDHLNQTLDSQQEFAASLMLGDVQDPVVMNFVAEEVTDRSIQVYPNPFSDHLNIRFQLDNEGFAQIRIFSLEGKLLLDREYMGEDSEIIEFDWSGRSDNGNDIQSGIYLLHVKSGDQVREQLLIKK